jgi:hypothetical protein
MMVIVRHLRSEARRRLGQSNITGQNLSVDGGLGSLK